MSDENVVEAVPFDNAPPPVPVAPVATPVPFSIRVEGATATRPLRASAVAVIDNTPAALRRPEVSFKPLDRP